MSEQDEKFKGWAIVEIMGHKKLAGHLSEQAIAGQSFIRVDVPPIQVPRHYGSAELVDVAAFTQFIGAGSIYCITPTTEEIAKAAARSFAVRPVQHLDLTPPIRPLLAAEPADDVDGEEDGVSWSE